MSVPEVCVLTGPTAVGKTGLSLGVARRLKAEIVSADSRQVYRVLDIGVAKPTASERAAVPHHLIGFVDPEDRYDAGRFTRDALRAIRSIVARGRLPLIVGGTMFYIHALTQGLADIPPADEEIESTLVEEAERVGTPRLHEHLARVDPTAAERFDVNDTQRVTHALAVYETTGRPLSSYWREDQAGPQVHVRGHVALMRPREQLYARINRRVDMMMQAGLADEVRVVSRVYGFDAPALRSPGYQEFADHFAGRATLEETVTLIKRNTRRFAKRQLSWLRNRAPDAIRHDLEEGGDHLAEVARKLAGRGGIDR